MVKIRSLLLILFSFITVSAYGWNAYGHRLVVQIAYETMTDGAKETTERYNKALDASKASQSLVAAGPWLDWLPKSFLPLHYIDIPYAPSGVQTIPEDSRNAVTALKQSYATLQDKEATSAQKGYALRVFIHVVGDIHQPLHAITLFNAAHPKGDAGGTKFRLGKNRIGKTLHNYWDRGGGFTLPRKSRLSLHQKARKLLQAYPCSNWDLTLQPETWAKESYDLAVEVAYTMDEGSKPNRAYQKKVREVATKRVVMAGCRLGYLLNQLAK